MRAFQLIGTRYEAISLPENGLWLAELELGLGLWQGFYKQTTSLWLRWYNAASWMLTRVEKLNKNVNGLNNNANGQGDWQSICDHRELIRTV